MSEKTIADKLFLKNAKSMVLLNGTAHPTLVEQLPKELIDETKGEADVVLMFAMNQTQLDQFLPVALERLNEKGSLWIAFLKSTASKATDISRDTINVTAKERGATTVAMISVDGDWSALRLKRL